MIFKRINEWEKSEKGKRIIRNIALCLFAAFNVCFFTPLDFFFSNALEISFPLLPIVISLLVVFAAVFTVLFSICTFVCVKANAVFRLLIFGFSLAFYIQANFLSLNMGEINGDQYSASVPKAALSLTLWAVVMAAPFFIRKKYPETCDNIIYYVSAAISVIQIFTLCYSRVMFEVGQDDDFRYDIVLSEGFHYGVVTSKNIDTYGGKNILVILADEYDTFCYEEAVKDCPESVSEFDGFTYYQNTVGAYNSTHLATPYLFLKQTADGSGTDETLFETLKNEYEVNMYTIPSVPNEYSVVKYAENYLNRPVNFGDISAVDGLLFKMTFFRGMPEVLKNNFFMYQTSLHQSVNSDKDKSPFSSDDLDFYNNISDTLEITDRDQFKLIYLNGIHRPTNLTRELECAPENSVSFKEQAIALNKILNRYFSVLKENGVYDNTEIFLMADHGVKDHCNGKYPLLMYKPTHQTETGVKISNAPISHDDFYPTLLKLAGGEPTERTIFDIEEDEQRTRTFKSNGETIPDSAKRSDNFVFN